QDRDRHRPSSLHHRADGPPGRARARPHRRARLAPRADRPRRPLRRHVAPPGRRLHRRRRRDAGGGVTLPPPRSGGGGPPENARSARRGVEGARDSRRRKFSRNVGPCSLAILATRKSCNNNEASSQAPPPPRYARSPSPAIAGAEGASGLVLAARFAPEFCSKNESHCCFAST